MQNTHLSGVLNKDIFSTMSATATITQETLNLRGYGGTIEDVKSLTPFSPDTPVEELKSRFKEDGVLWVGFSFLEWLSILFPGSISIHSNPINYRC